MVVRLVQCACSDLPHSETSRSLRFASFESSTKNIGVHSHTLHLVSRSRIPSWPVFDSDGFFLGELGGFGKKNCKGKYQHLPRGAN